MIIYERPELTSELIDRYGDWRTCRAELRASATRPQQERIGHRRSLPSRSCPRPKPTPRRSGGRRSRRDPWLCAAGRSRAFCATGEFSGESTDASGPHRWERCRHAVPTIREPLAP